MNTNDPHKMEENFNKVKNYLLELNYSIKFEDKEDGVIVIDDETSGINNMVVGIADPLVILEQYIFEMTGDNGDTFKNLLMKNRDIVHGAFVLDDDGKKVIFRDTLQIENLDLNEIEASLNSLELLLSEYSDELIKFSHN